MNLDGHPTFTDELRHLENREELEDIHAALCEWGQWSRQGSRMASIACPGVNRMARTPEHEMDPEAAPRESRPAFNERRMAELDAKIHDMEFPALWRRVLATNYIPARFLACVLPENQRAVAAKVSPTTYLSALEMALEKLA